MSRNKKLISINLVLAIICVILYVTLIPHSESVRHYYEKTQNTEYYSTLKTIQLTTTEVVHASCFLFMLVCIPTIIYVVKQILRLFIDRKQEIE